MAPLLATRCSLCRSFSRVSVRNVYQLKWLISTRSLRGGNNVVMCAVSVDARLNVNVALNRPSYQASTYRGIHHARYANDGNHDTQFVNDQPGSCAHSRRTPNPWWAVDLGVALHVRGVKFTNRGTRGMCAVSYVMIKCEPFLLTISLQRYV